MCRNLMKYNGCSISSNNWGYVLVVTMNVLLLLSVIGIAAMQTSNIEIQISGNQKKILEDFYATEGTLINVLEHTDWWLSDDFLKSNATTAAWMDRLDFDHDGNDDVMVEIRCVEKSDSAIHGLSDAANNYPSDRHSTPPPIDSGYSARFFNARKYAITATNLRSNTQLQFGVWKVFNKY